MAQNESGDRPLEVAFDLAVEAFNEAGAEYALIGGFAVAVHGLPRPTRDIDFLIHVPRLALPGLLEKLHDKGFTFQLPEVLKQLGESHLSAVHYGGLRVLPKPIQQPPDVWLGGRAASELRRCGRLGDGWLASFLSAEECAERRPVIEKAAADAGRAVDDEHYGAMVLFAPTSIPDALRARLAAVRPEASADDLVAVGSDRLRTLLSEYVGAGFSKLVVVPLEEPGAAEGWDGLLGATADAVLDLQT